MNPEYNAGWVGSDFTAGVLDAHVGFESGAFFAQLGPSILMVDGADAETGFSGKTGLSGAVADNVDMYGELSFAKFLLFLKSASSSFICSCNCMLKLANISRKLWRYSR